MWLVSIPSIILVLNHVGRRYTAGELASSNFFQIQKLQQVVAHCISRDEVEKQYRELMKIEETNKRIQQNLAVISQITDDINVSQSNLLDQFHHQETILQRKLDRSELHQLQSLVTKVVSYDEFRERTERNMEHFSHFEKKTDRTLESHDKTLNDVNARLDLLHIEVNKCASRRDLHVVAKELKLLSERVDLCATNADLEAAKVRIVKLLQLLESLQLELAGAHKRMNNLQLDIDTRATKEDMAKRLLIIDFEAAMQTVRDELELRPQFPVTNNHQERLELLEHCQQSDSRRIAVAMKFIEWFTSRGENYDHNIKILDRHLRDLITSDKTPRVHSYFIPGNRVQFTSTEAITPDLFRDQVLPPPESTSYGAITGTFATSMDRK